MRNDAVPSVLVTIEAPSLCMYTEENLGSKTLEVQGDEKLQL